MKPATKAIHKLLSGKEIEMTLVGEWLDIAFYYQGSDNNYWTFHTSVRKWVCIGNKIRNSRGKSLEGKDIETLPELSE